MEWVYTATNNSKQTPPSKQHNTHTHNNNNNHNMLSIMIMQILHTFNIVLVAVDILSHTALCCTLCISPISLFSYCVQYMCINICSVHCMLFHVIYIEK